MEVYARQAADREVGGFKLLEGQTAEQLVRSKNQTRQLLQLWIQVQGDRGEWRGGSAEEVLKDEALPDVITHVTFDTSFSLRAAVAQRAPINGIFLALDFNRRSLLDLGNASDAAEQNISSGVIHSADRAWADGVFEQLRKFFAERRPLWRLLHRRNTYDVLLMTIGFPFLFLWVQRMDAWLPGLSPVVRVGFLIYFAILLLFMFRLMFNLACRVFPRTKGPRGGTGGGFVEASFLLLTIVGWLSTVILDRMLGWLSHLMGH